MAAINFNTLQIASDINSFITNNTSLTLINGGGIGKALIDGSVIGMSKGFSEANKAMLSSSPLTASGPALDEWGTIVGISRRQARNAQVSVGDRNFNFFVTGGRTFGDINGGKPIVVPSGTLLFPQVSARDGTAIRYQTTSTIILSPGESVVYFSAVALSPGAKYNVPDNMVRFHNFTSYSDSINGSLRVTNSSPISSGQSIESDSDYRRRIMSLFRGDQGSISEIINIIRSMHGVSDVLTLPEADGLGSVTLIVQGTSPTTSQTLLSNIQRAIADKFSSEGLAVYIRSPNYIGVGVDILVEHLPDTSESTRISSEYNLQRDISRYLSELGVGAQMSINQIRQIVSGYRTQFKMIGTPTDLVEAVYVYKDSFGVRAPQKITEDYVVTRTEKIIPEFSVINAINVVRV